MRIVGNLTCERRLADPGVPEDKDDAPMPADGVIEGVEEHTPLALPPNHAREPS
jgi:hypothetical protein